MRGGGGYHWVDEGVCVCVCVPVCVPVCLRMRGSVNEGGVRAVLLPSFACATGPGIESAETYARRQLLLQQQGQQLGVRLEPQEGRRQQELLQH